ncbi:alpha-L-fucosidase [Microlunatus sp. Gsoil 973]|uniref:alpha-L-fucosidase n=1 Tax=Microlunatus sp. Gsoil 973 TaxID=2672569 RepID=UPI0012B44E3E|nr:alpha-L-fucosidase [Microlunatus sp. Gsoil 973]QGN33465.1 alpha-L-fucosidase [Microlunatus sp. Gsoil 973]
MNPEHAWFTHDRFGMFVHWGLYALPARHEWVMNRERIHTEDYEKYFDYFEADLYDPRAWAQAAKDAGMKYVVLTTKHHEGFAMWDSALTDYKVTKTPHGRDVVAAYVEALREADLKVGLYHSLIDWHHPDYTVDPVHPRRDDDNAAALNEGRDMNRYREYLHGQVRELLSNYGQIDYIFYDFSFPGRAANGLQGKGKDDWNSPELIKLTRELQPNIIVNDRLDIPGDLVTPEQYQPSGPMTRDGQPVIWEACQTLNGSWGYDRDNHDYKSVEMLIKMLVDGVSKDGNLLLNVGPTGRGNFDPRAIASLAGIGEWTKLHGRSIYGAGASEFTPPPDTRYTQNGKRLYLHLFSWPMRHVHLAGLAGKVAYAQLLNDASEIRYTETDPSQTAQNTTPGGQPPGTLTLDLPIQSPDVAVPVVEIFLK